MTNDQIIRNPLRKGCAYVIRNYYLIAVRAAYHSKLGVWYQEKSFLFFINKFSRSVAWMNYELHSLLLARGEYYQLRIILTND